MIGQSFPKIEERKNKSFDLFYSSLQYYTFFLSQHVSFIICLEYFKNPFITIWMSFGLMPLFDQFLELDIRNPSKEEKKIMKNDFRFKLPLYVTAIFGWVVFYYGMNKLFYGDFNYFCKFGILLNVVVVQCGSINVGHEILHKKNKFDQVLGTLGFLKSYYMHYYIEHTLGHHKKVATPEDPATALLNENVFEFIFYKAIPGQYKSAWNIENKISLEQYKTKYTLKNRMVLFTLVQILFAFSVFYIFGLQFFILQVTIAAICILILESMNYVEHYGLLRNKLENGKYENVNIYHSWNAPQRISNYYLFKLQRHSDHHENSLKEYQLLCSY